MVRGEVDIAWLPALEYVRATGLDPGLHSLAVPVERGRELHYRGVILAMKGMGLEELGDLVGRKFGPFVATARMPQGQVDRTRRALLALEPGSEASRVVFGGQGEFAGFEPADERIYQALRRQTQAVVTALQ